MLRLGVLAVAFTLLLATPAAAVTTTFTGSLDNDWNKAGNWSAGVPSGAADTANFNIANTYNVTLDISPSISAVNVGGSNVSLLFRRA